MCRLKNVGRKMNSEKQQGKTFRASLAVTDSGLAQAIMKKMDID